MTASSAEVRWFCLGQPPAAVRDWLSMQEHHRQPRRTDEYVLFPGCTSLGVKLRDGRFEIKALARAVGPVRFSPVVEGSVDTWIKLAFAVPDVVLVDQAVRAEAAMVSIDKERWLRKFALGDAAGPIEVAAETMPAQGCNVELVRLEVRDSDWWSLGLEAFGEVATIERCLQQTARAVLGSRGPPCQLAVANSMSYPAWFAALGLA